MVTICDHLQLLRRGELKHEVLREALCIGAGSAGVVAGVLAAKKMIVARAARKLAPSPAVQTNAIAEGKLTAEGGQKEVATQAPQVEQNSVEALPKLWKDPIEVNGRRVYQRDDLFDPGRISNWQERGVTVTGTNIERMKSGRAPIGFDNDSVELHHLTQSEVNGLTGTRGALAEVGAQFHSENTATLHIHAPRDPNLPKQTLPKYPSFRKDNLGAPSVQDAEFKKFQRAYWKTRGAELNETNATE